ncbi:MAG TPA: SDR family oxidoreductase [Alphaproteobacteria bacterium]|jgi:3-oxoacyl-[acyl-carrier protein] reductase
MQADNAGAVALSRTTGLVEIAPEIDFSGQTVLVTGAADGIGAALASALCFFGAHVVALDVQREKLENLRLELGDDCLSTIPFDLSETDPAVYMALADKIVSSSPSGKIDAYVMNAGVVKLLDIKKHNTVANTPAVEFMKLAQINAHSHAEIYKTLRDHFADNARIVVTSSPIVGRADPKTAAYSVTKGMLESYANNIAAELKGTGLILTGYVPPPVQNFLRTDLKPKEPLYAHPHGLDIAELPLRLAAPSVKVEFNGKVIAFGYENQGDRLRQKATLADGTGYDFMPRDPSDNGFIYDLRIRSIGQGGGDDGALFRANYSTDSLRRIMGLGRTPDMAVGQAIDSVYRAPDHVRQFRPEP